MKSEAIQERARNSEGQGATVTEVLLLDLLILLLKHRKFIVWFTFGVAVLTAIVALLVPSKHTAATLVLPPGQNFSMSSVLLMSQFGGASVPVSVAGAGLGINNSGAIFVSLFRSRTIKDALIQRFGLMSRYRVETIFDARRAFEDHSTVDLVLKDRLIRITVTDIDPNLAAELANAYVDEFRKFSASVASTDASQRRIFVHQQSQQANEGLTTARVADVAAPPDKRFSPHRTLDVILTTLIAFGFAVLWTFGFERRRQMQRDPGTSEKLLIRREPLFKESEFVGVGR